MGGPSAPPQEPLHGPLGIGLINGVSERLGGGGSSKRAYRRFLYVRMQTVCLSFHEPLCAYPWPLPARDAFSNPLLSASWVRFLAGNRPFGPCCTATQVTCSETKVKSKELDTNAFLLNLVKFSRIWVGGGLIFT